MSIKGRGCFPFITGFKIKNSFYQKIQWGDYDPSLYSAMNHYFFGTSVLQRWNGSNWIISKLKRYDSTNFVDAKLKVWDGTNWISVSTNLNN